MEPAEHLVPMAKFAAPVHAPFRARLVWISAATPVLICRLISQTAVYAVRLVRLVKFAMPEHAPFHAKLVWTNALDFA